MTGQGIRIAPLLEGRLARGDLLTASGAFAFKLTNPGGTTGSLFELRSKGFHFECALKVDRVELCRNGATASIVLRDPSGHYSVYTAWEPTMLYVSVHDGHATKKEVTETDSTLPPNALTLWARRQAVIPASRYSTERAFCDVLLNGLAGLEDKVAGTAMQSAFWDFEYDGPRIRARRPKHEPQIHSTVHGLLHDLALAKNLTILPEAAAGSGRLDFLVTAPLADGTTARACIEFKHGHSRNVVHGLMSQLPLYMQAQATDNGFYCVTWFKGDHFDKPSCSLGDLRGRLIIEKGNAGLSDIGLIFLDISDAKSPSKRS